MLRNYAKYSEKMLNIERVCYKVKNVWKIIYERMCKSMSMRKFPKSWESFLKCWKDKKKCANCWKSMLGVKKVLRKLRKHAKVHYKLKKW